MSDTPERDDQFSQPDLSAEDLMGDLGFTPDQIREARRWQQDHPDSNGRPAKFFPIG